MRLSFLEINLDHLKFNLNLIRKHIQNKPVMAVVKANAYGHGLVQVAHFYQLLNVHSLGVAILEEGILLRKSGITKPIVVFGGITEQQLEDFLNWDLEFFAPSLSLLKAAELLAESKNIKAKVHLKLDTGMGRIGAANAEATALIEEAICSENIEIKGVCSHLACADVPDDPMTLKQLDCFLEMTSIFEKLGAKMPPRHLANSGGVLYFPETHLDLVRPGILLYGVYPDANCPQPLKMKPAISLKSRVTFRKKVSKGTSVSYGATWKSEMDSEILTIPVGYGDGYRRHLSNQGKVLINNKKYPIAGRICMDQFMVDCGSDSVEIGQEVVLLGSQGKHKISVEDISVMAETIPYEILTSLAERLPRIYKKTSS